MSAIRIAVGGAVVELAAVSDMRSHDSSLVRPMWDCTSLIDACARALDAAGDRRADEVRAIAAGQ